VRNAAVLGGPANVRRSQVSASMSRQKDSVGCSIARTLSTSMLLAEEAAVNLESHSWAMHNASWGDIGGREVMPSRSRVGSGVSGTFAILESAAADNQ